MDAAVFWDVIGKYNSFTWIYQCIIAILLLISAGLAVLKNKAWLLKAALGVGNIFIGVVFFLVYGTEAIQKYFAAPLFLLTGFLLFREAVMHRGIKLGKPVAVQWILLSMFILYPLASSLLGHTFPHIATYIMPCPFISLSIVVYSCYEQKSKLILLLLTIWGVTGLKAFFVNAFEDIILLICGLFCLWILIRTMRRQHKA